MTIFGRVVRWLRRRPRLAGNRYDPGDKVYQILLAICSLSHCVFRDNQGFRGVSYISVISWLDGFFICSFLSSEVQFSFSGFYKVWCAVEV